MTKTRRPRRAAPPRRVTPIPQDPDAIREAREARGWRQIDLARHLRISRSHMCEIEAGTRGVPPALLLDMARILGRRVESLKAARAA